MEAAKISLVKSLIIITFVLMLAFIPQINQETIQGNTIVNTQQIEPYWDRWYYWHRWRSHLSKVDMFYYQHWRELNLNIFYNTK